MVLDFGRLLLIDLTLRMLLRVNQLETNRTLVLNRLGLLTGTGQFAGFCPGARIILAIPGSASALHVGGSSPLQVHVHASGPAAVTQPSRGLRLPLELSVLCSLRGAARRHPGAQPGAGGV